MSVTIFKAKREFEPFLGHIYTMMKDLDTARDLGLENGAPLLIHFEADGTAEVVLSFFEDQDLGTTLHDIPDMAALREAAIDWAMRAIAGQAKGEWL